MNAGPESHLCWRCASEKGLARDLDPATLLSTDYQLKKFVKHTVLQPPSSTWVINSVFKDPTINGYEKWVVNSVASGCVAIDPSGNHSYIFAAGREVGLTYKGGSFHTVGDAVKVVLPIDPGRIHAYPMSSHVIAAKTCSNCGEPVVT